MHNNILSFGFEGPYNNFSIQVIWKIETNSLYKFIDFSVLKYAIHDNKLLLCSYLGDIALMDLDYVPVGESLKSDENYINFDNNQLIFSLDTAIVGESIIYDTSGKIIVNLGNLPFIIGKNIIGVNQSLPVGIYILIIKTDKEQISKKFIVDR